MAGIAGSGMVANAILNWRSRNRIHPTLPDSPPRPDSPPQPDSPPRSDSRASAIKNTIDSLALLFAPGTLIVALAFYFGWVRTHSLYAYFGIDADELGLSTSEYVLRSADVLWPTLAALTLLVLLAFSGHSWLLQRIAKLPPQSRASRLQVAIRVVITLGILLFGVGLLMFAIPYQQGSPLAPLAPLCLALSFAAMGYSRLLGIHLRTRQEGTKDTGSSSRLEQSISWILLTLITLCVFWAAAGFAEDLGTGRAQALEASGFSTTPDVILYSSSRIKIDAHGIVETDLGLAYAPYRYRYSGLKLLVRANNKLLLIPFDWSTSNAFALVIPENNSVRLEFAPNF
jgi:hypothetical protein